MQDKVVLVTGGSGDIGQAICTVFAAQGSKVIASDIKEDSGLVHALSDATRKFLPEIAEPVHHSFLPADITDEAQVKDLFERIYEDERYGNVHVLVNSAGITGDDLVLRKGAEHMKSVLNVNLVGPYNTSRELIRRKRRKKGDYGRIINVGSIIGQVGNAGQAFYSASKGGLHALTKSLANEVQQVYKMPDFTVNAVAPGFIDTQMTAVMKEEIKQRYIKQIPMQRAGTPMEVALPILFLASRGASYITAAVIPIDGCWVRYS